MRIAASYAQLLYDYLNNRGLAPQSLLGELPQASGGLLPMADWQALLQRTADRLAEPALGLRIAETIGPRHFGVAGYAALACPNLGEALLRLERYHSLIYDANPARLSQRDGSLQIEWGVEQGRPGQLVDEVALAALVQLARNLTGQSLRVRGLDFVNPPPPDIRPYESFFGGPVRFAQSATRLRVPSEYLALPMRQTDPALLALLDQQAEGYLHHRQRGSLVEQCQQALIPLLREGRGQLEALAERLHRSPRTLQRHLAETGLSFQQVLDDTRRQLAEGYLCDTHLPLGEIAALLGYSEQSAFSRAFRHWHGISPLQWRKERF
ncbi:AraC family transcriptional regulator [Zestomonas carbonaria]|uniref:HTH-type transcriptional regulator VirS n=1 Tax=Zestomonas carbonaria TaxID=2762745 RepID=A0A7U7I9C2_9GAMM|nr:AraC family transcriptional regulator [Pseudomonas carbonaria]CAD5107601.1 HTH-type transcriptional regulator VirS [Pseudomonas carbonaria]